MHPYFRSGSNISAAVIAIGMTVGVVVMTLRGYDDRTFLAVLIVATVIMTAIATAAPFVLPAIDRRQRERLYVEGAIRSYLKDERVVIYRVGTATSLYHLTGSGSVWADGHVLDGVRIGWISMDMLYRVDNAYWRLNLDAPVSARWTALTPLLVIFDARGDSWHVVPFVVTALERRQWEKAPTNVNTVPVQVGRPVSPALFTTQS